MPPREPGAGDPMELVGVEVPSDPGAHEEMIRTCAVEFRRQGWDRRRILAILRSPLYASVHGAWRILGEARCAVLVDEALEPFSPPPPAALAARKEA